VAVVRQSGFFGVNNRHDIFLDDDRLPSVAISIIPDWSSLIEKNKNPALRYIKPYPHEPNISPTRFQISKTNDGRSTMVNKNGQWKKSQVALSTLQRFFSNDQEFLIAKEEAQFAPVSLTQSVRGQNSKKALRGK
jgi:hypothetical protein